MTYESARVCGSIPGSNKWGRAALTAGPVAAKENSSMQRERTAPWKTLLTGLLIAAAVTLTLISPAHAATRCSGESTVVNRSGYLVELSNYRADGMHCSSVRYVTRFLRRQLRRQSGWPRLGRPFFDGYVTWHCWRRGHLRWQCDEYTSDTSFRFTGRVW